jgi:tRNA(fMet)-specific endonuclease VapC
MNLCFLDSCIVIDYINGKLDLADSLSDSYCFNSIVDMEVIVGAKNKRDLHTINKKLSNFNLIDIDQDILNLARDLINKHSLSQNMTIYDAIIAATCMVYDISLWTYNKKDFKYLKDLTLIDKE